MPKLNPYCIKNEKSFEIVQEIENYQIKKSPLSPAAKGKVINKSGSNYVSENQEGYGPGNNLSLFDDDSEDSNSQSMNWSTGLPHNHPYERLERQQRERHRDEELNRAVLFVAETAVKATAVSTFTTLTSGLAPAIGGGAWIGGKWLESRNDEFLQFLGKGMGEVGEGMFFSGLFSNSTVGEIARKNDIDLKKLERIYDTKGNVETGWAIAKHDKHKREGRGYKSDCELCNL